MSKNSENLDSSFKFRMEWDPGLARWNSNYFEKWDTQILIYSYSYTHTHIPILIYSYSYNHTHIIILIYSYTQTHIFILLYTKLNRQIIPTWAFDTQTIVIMQIFYLYNPVKWWFCSTNLFFEAKHIHHMVLQASICLNYLRQSFVRIFLLRYLHIFHIQVLRRCQNIQGGEGQFFFKDREKSFK